MTYRAIIQHVRRYYGVPVARSWYGRLWAVYKRREWHAALAGLPGIAPVLPREVQESPDYYRTHRP